MGTCYDYCPATTADAIVCPQDYNTSTLSVIFGDHFNASGLSDSSCFDDYDQWLMDTGFVSPDNWAIALMMPEIFLFSSEMNALPVLGIEAEGDCVSTECDLFWGFGDGEKYITFHHDFDGHSWASDKSVSGIWIYPACEGPLAEGNISTVLQDSSSYDDEADYAIRDALAGGDRTGWHRLTTEQNEGNWWPVTFEITNDISSHLVNFTFTTAKLSVSCIYYDSFAVNTSFVAGLQPDVSAGSADDIHIDYVAVDSYATPSIPSTSVLHSETSLVC